MTQPPLSKQIMELEEELGSTLFLRSGRQVSLTPAGETFLKKAYGILEQIDVAKTETRRVELGQSGELSLGFADDTVFGPLADLVGDFLSEYPEVFLRSILDLSPLLASRVLQGDLDAALVEPPLPVEANNLASMTLPESRLVAVLPVDHPLAKRGQPVSMRELRNERFSLCSDTPVTSFELQIKKLFEEAGFRPQVAHVSNWTMMYARIAARAGHIAIAGEHSLPPNAEGFIQLPIRSRASRIRFALIWDSENNNEVLHNFIDYMRQGWPQI